MKGKTFFHICELVVSIGILVLIAYILLMPNLYGENTQISDKNVKEVEGWYKLDSEGNRQPVEFPSLVKNNREDTLILETVLPENVSAKDYLSTRLIKCSSSVYVDGEFRESNLEDNHKIFRKEDFSRYIFIPLMPEDSGRVLRLELNKNVVKDFAVESFYIGEKSSEVMFYRNSRIPDIVIGFALLVIGICASLYGLVVRLKTGHPVNVDYLGWALFLIAVWDITQTEFRDLYFSNIEAISLIPLFCLIGFPMAMCLYFNSLQEGRYSKLYGICLSLSGINFVVSLILHFVGIKSLYSEFDRVFVVLGVSIAVVLVSVVMDFKAGYAQKYPFVVAGTILLSICGVIQMVAYLVDPLYSQSLGLTVGTFLFVIFAVSHSIQNVTRLNTEKQAAVRTAELKGEFLASMSHEIRTPINAVLGMNEMILRESKEEAIKNYATEVETAGKMLLSLINDILDFSKLESGKMPVVEAEYEIKPLILSCYRMLEGRAKEKGLSLKINVDANIPAKLVGDSVRITQVLVNLLTNAVKYTESGSVELGVKAVDVTSDSATLVCSVTDTGKGIREEDREKLFAAFQRLNEDVNSAIEGTGLGLAITKTLIHLMGGEITVESELDKGSRFIVKIPQKIIDYVPMGELSGDNLGSETRKQSRDLFKASDVKLLVVDDVSVNLKVVSSFLKETGIEVDTAISGEKCIEKTLDKEYDLILLDHMMPGKDGVETFHEIRQNPDNPNKKTPIIILTANAIMGAREQFLEEGFDDFISKPFSIMNIQKTILKFLPKEKVTEYMTE